MWQETVIDYSMVIYSASNKFHSFSKRKSNILFAAVLQALIYVWVSYIRVRFIVTVLARPRFFDIVPHRIMHISLKLTNLRRTRRSFNCVRGSLDSQLFHRITWRCSRKHKFHATHAASFSQAKSCLNDNWMDNDVKLLSVNNVFLFRANQKIPLTGN